MYQHEAHHIIKMLPVYITGTLFWTVSAVAGQIGTLFHIITKMNSNKMTLYAGNKPCNGKFATLLIKVRNAIAVKASVRPQTARRFVSARGNVAWSALHMHYAN